LRRVFTGGRRFVDGRLFVSGRLFDGSRVRAGPGSLVARSASGQCEYHEQGQRPGRKCVFHCFVTILYGDL